MTRTATRPQLPGARLQLPGKGPTKTSTRRWLWVAALAGVVLAWLGGVLLLLAFVLAVTVWRYRRKLMLKRKSAGTVIYDLSEVIDLFLLGTSAGLTIWLTLQEIAALVSNSLSATLRQAVLKVKQGSSLADALEWLSHQHDGQLRLLTRPLLEAERYGVELAPSLVRASTEARSLRRHNGELAAKGVAVKLMFPLVLCILPAFALMTVVPQLANTLNLLQTS